MEIKELKFVRLTDPSMAGLIPRYLIDQAKDKDFTTERFYALAPMLIANKLNIIGLFADADNKVKGFMWATINILSEQLYVSVISIDKEYQNCSGDVLQCVFEVIKGFPNDISIKQTIKIAKLKLKETIQLVTKRPKSYERRGWHRADVTIMEKEI